MTEPRVTQTLLYGSNGMIRQRMSYRLARGVAQPRRDNERAN